ncbi:MAG: dockerin type I repeat-containing protein [Lachnospiraceae bacterium]
MRKSKTLKKMIAGVLVAAFAMSMAVVPGKAATQYFELTSPTVANGEATVELKATSANTGFGAAMFEITYDSTKLTYDSFENKTSALISVNGAAGTGLIKVAMASATNIAGACDVLAIKFKSVSGATGTAAVQLKTTEYYSVDDTTTDKKDDVVDADGTVTVGDTYKLGDVNKDGGINAVDASLALQASVNKVTLDAEQKTLADANKDGSVNAVDASLILQASVNKITLS